MKQIAYVANKDNTAIIAKIVAVGEIVVKHRRKLDEKKSRESTRVNRDG